jgi:hypothetical protein
MENNETIKEINEIELHNQNIKKINQTESHIQNKEPKDEQPKFAVLLILAHGSIVDVEPIQTDINIFKMSSSAPCYINIASQTDLLNLLDYWNNNMPFIFERATNYEDMKNYFYQLVMQSQSDVMKQLTHDPSRNAYKNRLKNVNLSQVNRPFESNYYYDKLFSADSEFPELDVMLYTSDTPDEKPMPLLKSFESLVRLFEGQDPSTIEESPMKNLALSDVIDFLKMLGYDSLFIYDTSCSNFYNLINPEEKLTERGKRQMSREIIKAETTKKQKIGGKRRNKTKRKRKTKRKTKMV